MSDLEEFLAHTLQRHALARTGVRNGDAILLIEMLSTRDPVTLFPAAQPPKRGWAEVRQAFQRVASLYSNSTPVTFDLVAAGVSGDLA
jgi:ketosteroid isomerase-like protein